MIDSLVCGGAEKSLVSLLPLIDYSRYDVDLLMFSRGGEFERFIPTQVNVIEHALYGNGVFDEVRRIIHQVNFSFQVRFGKFCHGAERHWRAMHKVIKPLDGTYDIAIAYQQGLPTYFVATMVEASKKIAWINADVYEAGYDMDYCRQFYEKMNHIVPVSEALREKLAKFSPWIKNKLTCIYDIVNQDLIQKLAKESINDMISKDGEILIVTVGRLAVAKNHLLAVEAARILRDCGVRFKWFFVGDGGTRDAVEKRIAECDLKEHVILLGLKENPYPYMARADIYVQTSSFEGFGLTIAEAKILHKPIVSTNFDVVYDQIVDGENGLIAEMTPESVAESIEKLINDRSLRDYLVHNLESESNQTYITEVEKFHSLLGLSLMDRKQN